MARIETWEISDGFWNLASEHLPKPQRNPEKLYKRKPGGGRKPADPRAIFAAIVYVLRNGLIWNALPKEKFGVCSSSVHRYFLEWAKAGFFRKLWAAGLAKYDELKGLELEWQSADGCMVKAPLALESVGKNPTDRGRNGTKRMLLTDGAGVPLAVVLAGANRHDSVLLEPLLDEKTMDDSGCEAKNLCLDAAFVGKESVVEKADYIPHIRPRGEERLEASRNPKFKPP
jgi:putative transposase